MSVSPLDVSPLTISSLMLLSRRWKQWLCEVSQSSWSPCGSGGAWGMGVRVAVQLQPRRPLSKLLLNKVIQHVWEQRRKSQLQQTFASSFSDSRFCCSLIASLLLCDVDSFFFISNPLPPSTRPFIIYILNF